jgi:hypothetical protein
MTRSRKINERIAMIYMSQCPIIIIINFLVRQYLRN